MEGKLIFSARELHSKTNTQGIISLLLDCVKMEDKSGSILWTDKDWKLIKTIAHGNGSNSTALETI